MSFRKQPEDAILAAILICCVVILCLTGIYASAGVVNERRCLQAGYPSSKTTWLLDAYCIKRIDQTDTVVPLDTVRRR